MEVLRLLNNHYMIKCLNILISFQEKHNFTLCFVEYTIQDKILILCNISNLSSIIKKYYLSCHNVNIFIKIFRYLARMISFLHRSL